MIFIDIDRVFVDDWQDTITIITTRAMGIALLNSFSEDMVYFSGGERVTPTEEQSEAIESGIGDITTAVIA